MSARFNGGGGSGVALFPRAGLDALAEASPSSSHRIIRPFLVLSQSFADRLWCGQNREVVDNGRSRDQFGPEGPEVSTSAAWRSPAVRDQAKGQRVAGDPNLKLEARRGTDSSQTPRWRELDSNPSVPIRTFRFLSKPEVSLLPPSGVLRFIDIVPPKHGTLAY